MSLALMHPPGAYNSRAPYQQAIGSMRRAPVLMRPIVGKRAIAHAAMTLAEKQAADERKRSEWQQHVWQENLTQQTSSLARGAEHAYRNQQYARQLEAQLEAANERLAHAENRMGKTEHELRNVLREQREQREQQQQWRQQQQQQQQQPHRNAPRRRPQSAGAASHGQRTGHGGAGGEPSAHIKQAQHRQQAASSSARSAPSLRRGEDPMGLDPALYPAWVPGLGEPKPNPTQRWASARGPCETLEMHHRRAPQAPKLKPKFVPVTRHAMHNGQGARDALAPPDGWDGPYRARRPDGLIGPRELIVGLAPTNDHEHMPFRRALEAQYRRPPTGDEPPPPHQREMLATTRRDYTRPESRSIN